jgi:hypothetical protein
VRKQFITAVSLTALTLASGGAGWAQTSEEFKALREDIGTMKEIQSLRREVEGLKAGQQGLQKDLQEIKTLLQTRPAAAAAPAAPAVPQNVVFDLDGAHLKGDKSAKLTLVEFTDYQ